MFRLDEERVIDATLSGGLARYINHSCNPNCVAETVEVDRDFRIIIFAKRRINRGEEVSFFLSIEVVSFTNYVFVCSWRTITNLILRTTNTRYPVCVKHRTAKSG